MWFTRVLALVLLSVQAFADCKRVPVLQNGQVVLKDFKEGESLSLFDEGNSLENFKVQDQDGLGTCYANALTVSLQSQLPDNPSISYIHAGLANGTLGWEANWYSDPSHSIKKSGNQFVGNAGFGCQALAALKKAGGACLINNQSFEDNVLKSSAGREDVYYSQQTYLRGLSGLLDHMHTLKDNQAARDQAKKDFDKILEVYNGRREKLSLSCSESMEENKKDATSRILNNYFYNNLNWALYDNPNDSQTRKDCKKAMIDHLKPYLSHHTMDQMKNEEYTITIKDDFKDKFFQHIFNDEDVKKSADAYSKDYLSKVKTGPSSHYTSETLSPEATSSLTQSLLKASESFFHDEVYQPHKANLDAACSNVIGFKSSNTNNFFTVANDYAVEDFVRSPFSHIFLNEDEYCKTFEPASLMSGIELYQNKDLQCMDRDFVINSFNIIQTLSEVSGGVRDKLKQQLFGEIPYEFEDYEKIVTPGCDQAQNKLNLDHLSCSFFSMCRYSDEGNAITSAVYSGEDSCYNLGTAKYLARMHLLSEIKEGRASTVSVCTGFMVHDRYVDTKFCEKEVSGVDGHEYHSMAITGYKCQKGNIHYEIQNSWGKNDCPNAANRRVKDYNGNPVMECVKEDGRNTGRFYVNESYLIKNMTGFGKIYEP